MTRSLFIFRRDLRLDDNTGLNEALRAGDPVAPCFILDPTLLARWRQSEKRLAFLFQSLAELQSALRAEGASLIIRQGDPAAVVRELCAGLQIARVFVNRDHTPWAGRRDLALADACRAAGARLHASYDSLLNAPSEILKADGSPYTVFTPWFRKASARPVAAPEPLHAGAWFRGVDAGLEQFAEAAPFLTQELPQQPGLSGAGEMLARLRRLGNYGAQRDLPAAEQTSRASAHLRFGSCSPRRFYAAVRDAHGPEHPLIRQLYWRDFYTQIATHFPHVFGHAFRRRYDTLRWREDEADFDAWRLGRTGFPIVDAGMRELLATGAMHTRTRMITASFLVKNLHIDWRLGEAHFAQHLIDYDPAVNNGNWQWAASTGCDAQPWFRVFNPWRQQWKFDRDCAYVKRWVPELAAWPARAIHRLEKEGDFYLPQMVDLRASSEAIKEAFREVDRAWRQHSSGEQTQRTDV